jgi:hypothetical protein
MHCAKSILLFCLKTVGKTLEAVMNSVQAIRNIKAAINGSPRNSYIAELHLQIIKYAEFLQGVTGKEFCEGIGVGPSFGTEFAKMRKIAPRLRRAGMDPARI